MFKKSSSRKSAKISKCDRFKIVPNLIDYCRLDSSMVRASAYHAEMVGGGVQSQADS
jgi:hypothetical protein